jgi:hypothetical protein
VHAEIVEVPAPIDGVEDAIVMRRDLSHVEAWGEERDVG